MVNMNSSGLINQLTISASVSPAQIWRSARQSVVALLTNEAEYMAAAECAKHLIWMKSFLFDVMNPVPSAIPFYVDNTSAIDTALGDIINRRSKHIYRLFHFFCEQVQDGSLRISHVPTDKMLADHLTKPLGPTGICHALRRNNMLKDASEWGVVRVFTLY